MIAITGHTSGIGQAIANWFERYGHEVVGFSRSTGDNLADSATIQRIASSEATILVNNAFHEMAQVDLLYAWFDRWHDCHKTILCISSNSGDGTKSFPHPYAVYKAALDKATAQLQNCNPTCRILNLRPGYVDTPRVQHITAPKLSAAYVAEVAGWMMCQSGLIKSLTVEPH